MPAPAESPREVAVPPAAPVIATVELEEIIKQLKEREDKDFADPEFNTDYYTFTRPISIDGTRVSTGVVCQPGSVAAQ